jgi:hypothetical protein
VRDDIPYPRSAILTVILSLPSNTLELEVSSPKLWLGLESMDMTEVDNGTSDVAAVEADGAIDINEGPVFELDTVPPECDGAIWVSNDGPGGFEGYGLAFLSNRFESIDVFDKRSAASSVSFPLPTSPAARSFISLLVYLGIAPALPTEPGLLPFPSILLIPRANLSNIGLEPHEEDGDGRGWELCIEIDSECGVWFPPRPFGTPTSLVGGDAGFDADMASSDWIIESMSSIQMRTFSDGWSTIRSWWTRAHRGDTYLYEWRHIIYACNPSLTTSAPRSPNERHGDPFILMSLDQTEQSLAKDLEDHADVMPFGPLYLKWSRKEKMCDWLGWV